MNELISKSNNGLSANGITTSSIIQYFRQNQNELSAEDQNTFNRFAVMLDNANRAIETANLEELKQWYTSTDENGLTVKDRFLKRYKSGNTRKTYEIAIEKLESFCTMKNIHLLQMTYSKANQFIESDFCNRTKEGKETSRSSQRLTIAGISAFYSYLVKHSDNKIYNSFKGISRPKARREKIKNVPTAEQLQVILDNTDGIIHASIYAMSKRGFRIGALKNLHLNTKEGKTEFRTTTKGKLQEGIVSNDIMQTIQNCGLPKIEPFADRETNTLEKQIERALNKLAERGLVPAYEVEKKVNGKTRTCTCSTFSCHSFRHYFAVNMYKKLNYDIETLRKLLNHESVNITQVYLQSLGFSLDKKEINECL